MSKKTSRGGAEARRQRILAIGAAMVIAALIGRAVSAVEPAKDKITWPYVSEKISPIEELTVPSPTGFKAPVVVRRPPGDGPFPLVVVLHGGRNTHSVRGLRHQATETHNVSRLLAAGYAIAAPTFSSRQADPQTTDALRDCLAVIEHVRQLPKIDSNSMFVFGGSGGGSLALELAGETKLNAVTGGEPATVLFAGILTKESNRQLDAMMADPLKYCGNEKTKSFTRAKIDKIACPVLIVHSDVHAINKINDVFVIPMLKEAGKTPEVVSIPGAKHGFYFASAERPDATLKCFEATESFFRKYTRTAPAPIAANLLQQRPVAEGGRGVDDEPPAKTQARSASEGPGGSSATTAAREDASKLDWDRVRALRRRFMAGEKLSADDQAYYDRGVAAWPNKKK